MSNPLEDLGFTPVDLNLLADLINHENDGICCCKVCRKKPDEIQEYINCALDENTTPEEYVKQDGTYNPVTKKFYCTNCYIKIGMPKGTA